MLKMKRWKLNLIAAACFAIAAVLGLIDKKTILCVVYTLLTITYTLRALIGAHYDNEPKVVNVLKKKEN
ncbi:membrane protein [Clostridium acetobutylicum]|nr:membrane protein [Clostridium acetobutylicum]